jgi:hypothetical protein
MTSALFEMHSTQFLKFQFFFQRIKKSEKFRFNLQEGINIYKGQRSITCPKRQLQPQIAKYAQFAKLGIIENTNNTALNHIDQF